MSCGEWFCFCFHREKPSPTQLFPILCISLVLLVLAGFFNLLSLLEASLYQKCRNITCSLPMSKPASCHSGAGLAEVKSTAFPAELGGEFVKCGQLAGEVCRRSARAGYRHTNPKYCHFLEFHFLGYPAQPLLSVTAILGCIFPH